MTVTQDFQAYKKRGPFTVWPDGWTLHLPWRLILAYQDRRKVRDAGFTIHSERYQGTSGRPWQLIVYVGPHKIRVFRSRVES